MTHNPQPTSPVRKNRPKSRYELVFATLMRHPGRWALISTEEWTGNVVRLRREKGPLGFEFVVRDGSKAGHVGRLYARYNPESGAPFIPEIQWEDPPPVDQKRRKK